MLAEIPCWSNGLALFGKAWPTHHSRRRDLQWVKGLLGFSAEWRAGQPTASVKIAELPERLSAEHLAMALTALNGAVRDILNRGDAFDPWVAARLRRDEVRNASVLAAFLTPSRTGDFAYRFLHALLRRLDDPQGSLPTLATLRHGYRVRTEDCPLGLASERVDLTLEGPSFILGIEVKIDAPEGDDQFGRYVRTITRRARDGDRSAHVVILARRRMKVPDAIAADWSDVASAAREIAATDPANPISRVLRSFAAHVGGF